MSTERDILPRTLTVSVCTFASRVLGLVRDLVTAHLFALSGSLDLFLIAFTVPNLFRRLFGEGALSAAFIPVFSRELHNPEGDARRLLNVAMTALAALLSVLTFLGWLGCGAALLFGSLSARGETFCVLLAIMLPYLPLICLSALAGAALNAKGHFLVPALAPALLNVCWIAAVWFFGKSYGVNALSVGVLFSGLLQYVAQMPLLWRHGLQLRPVWDLANRGLRRTAKLMAPVALGIGVIQVNVMMDRLIAKFCVPGDGAVSALHFGNRLVQFPLGVLGLALATAVFPSYARQAAAGNREQLARTVNLAVRTTMFLSFPCMAALLAFRVPIVQVLFEHGAFTSDSTARTARVLLYYATGLWAFCGVHVVARAFYALEDMRTPVRIAMWMVGLNLVLNLALVWPMQESGLALASSLTAAGNLGLLSFGLRKRIGPVGERVVAVSVLKCAIASGLAGLAGFYTHRAVGRLVGAGDQVNRLPVSGLVALACAFAVTATAFLVLAWVLRVPELREFTGRVFHRNSRQG